jgi:hypothetical protein
VTPLVVVAVVDNNIAGDGGLLVEDAAITARRWAAVRVTADSARRIAVVVVVVVDVCIDL